jgi:hypothetical protein
MPANTKNYVLFMLFIKYVSDKYGESDDFAPPVTIPKGASFKDMIALKGKSDIGDKINTKIIQPLIDANSRLASSDFPDFNDPTRRGFHRGNAQGHQECLPFRPPPQRTGDVVCPNGDTFGGGTGLRDLQTGVDSGSAEKAGEPVAGNTPAVHQSREPLSVGTAALNDSRASGR